MNKKTFKGTALFIGMTATYIHWYSIEDALYCGKYGVTRNEFNEEILVHSNRVPVDVVSNEYLNVWRIIEKSRSFGKQS